MSPKGRVPTAFLFVVLFSTALHTFLVPRTTASSPEEPSPVTTYAYVSRDFRKEVRVGSQLERALVFFQPGPDMDLRRFDEIIESEGGKVEIVLSSNTVIAKLSRSTPLVGKYGIKNIWFQKADPAAVATYSEEVVSSVEIWNEMLLSESENRTLNPPQILNDVIKTETHERGESQYYLGEAPYGAGFYDTSEYMLGDISVAIVLPESDGSIDRNQENWASSDITKVVSEITEGVNWWRSREPNADLRFWIHWIKVDTAYEPISRPSTDDYLWINDVMNKLGYTSGYYITKVQSYANDVRASDGTDWAFVIFVAHSWWDDFWGDGEFADGWFAYARLGGPYMVMTWSNNGYGINNMDAVTAHEMGHVFYALDEYHGSGDSPSDRSGYLNVENQNHQDGGSSNVPCIMRGLVSPYTTGSVCQYTHGQVGWRDSNSNGIMDILDFYPEDTITSSPPSTSSDTTPDFSGQANSRQVYPNSNPYSYPRNNITINTITSVEYYVDDNHGNQIRGPIDANPSDGSFDSSLENWSFTAEPLSPGTYRFRIISWNSAGNGIMSSIWLTITSTITFQATGIGSDSSGVIITIDGIGYSHSQLPRSFTWTVASTHTIAASSPVSAGTGKQYVWTSWSDGGGRTHTHTVPSSAKTVTASYKKQYYLTVNSAYDSPNPTSNWFDAGTSITASVTAPSSGPSGTRYVCTGWSGSGSVPVSGSGASVTFTINMPSSITWNWKTQYQVTFTSSGIGSDSSGTVVTVNGNAKTQSQLPYIAWYDSGSTISYDFTLTVSASSGKQYVWTSTSGLGQSGRTESFTASTAGTVTGTYKTQYYLTMQTSPSDGGTGSPSSGWFDAASTVQIQATANTGYQLREWTGSGTGSYSGTNNPSSIKMNGPVTETANFQPHPEGIVFAEDFDGYVASSYTTSGGWQMAFNGAGDQYQIVTGATSVSGSKSFQMLGKSSLSSVVMRPFTCSWNILGYEVYVKVEGYGSAEKKAQVGFYNKDAVAGGRYYADVALLSDGSIVSGDAVLQNYNPNTWYKICVVLDKTKNTYSVWINGILKATDLATSNSNELSSFALAAPGAVKAFFDDAKVFAVSVNPPSAPELLSPSDGASGVSLTPTLSWSSVSADPAVDHYRLGIWDDSNAVLVYMIDVSGTSQVIPTGILKSGHTYRWIVWAHYPIGYGPSTAIWRFTT